MTSLTTEQGAVLEDAVSFVKSGDYSRHWTCAGLAGTGKTVALVELVKRLRELGANPAVCSPTGKAAHVINSKCPELEATTIHRRLSQRPFDEMEAVRNEIALLEREGVLTLSSDKKQKLQALYKQLDSNRRGQGGNTLWFQPVTAEDFADSGHDCLVFDEASMIGTKYIYDRLIAHLPVPLLFFGDHGQLPPVNDKHAIDLKNPTQRLTKVLRQDANSGIIPFCYSINKEGRYLYPCDYPDVTCVKERSVQAVKPFLPDHQVVCFMNRTRWAIAPLVREARGFDFKSQKYWYLPMVGEKIIIDSNNYKLNLLRGEVATVLAVDYPFNDHPKKNPYQATVKVVMEDSGVEREIPIALADLAGETEVVAGATTADDRYWKAHMQGLAVQFDGVITAHKAQGSEWEKVVYFADMWQKHDDWRRHAYTGTTRARSELVVISTDFRR